MTELFTRFDANPIIVPPDVSSTANAVFNPGATVFEGRTLLLMRVEDRRGFSRLVVATSADGVTGWRVEPERGLAPDTGRFEERWGVEDPRITEIDGVYYVVYTGFSEGGPLVCLATTRDFVTFERQGVLMSPEDKDASLFPQTFDGRWALLHRPASALSSLGAHVWLSWSPDLRYWGGARLVLEARRGGWWDANKVGAGPPPLRTAQGWLLCYHGVRTTVSGALYRVGLALLDLHDPCLVLARTDEWVFGPLAPYERTGDVPGVVFPNGWVLDPDGDTLRMYYGAADNVVAGAWGSLARILDRLGA
jgi:predicted GH43/DUF377 family glycosyl hydrolase